MKAFILCPTTLNDKYFRIGITSEVLDLIPDLNKNFVSSYHILDARILGLSYPNYLAYCVHHNAILLGKKGYTYPVWQNDIDPLPILTQLNEQWEKLIDSVSFEKVQKKSKSPLLYYQIK